MAFTVKAEFNKFCQTSSIHGIQYLNAESGQILRIFLWSVIIIFSFVTAGIFLGNLATSWHENPIVTTIASASLPIQRIPFPAITICNEGFDHLAFAQKTLNAIEINDKVRQDFHYLFEPWIKHVKSAVKESVGKKDWIALRNNSVFQCHETIQIYTCMAFLIMHDIFQHNATLGMSLKSELVENYTRNAFHTQNTFVKFIQDAILPPLREIVRSRNIPCDQCLVESFGMMRVARELDDLICNDSSKECQKSIKEAEEFRLIIQNFYNQSVFYLGTLAVNKAFRAPIPYAFFDAMVQKLMQTNGSTKYLELSVGLNMNVDTNLGMLQYSNDILFICDRPDHKCFNGTFEGIFTLMKEIKFQPHIVDLNSRFNQSIQSLYGSLKEDTVKVLTGYEPRTISRMEHATNMEPFIPYCAIGNAWSGLPTWGSLSGFVTKELDEFCTLFRPSFTDQGICYSFNSQGYESLLHESDNLRAFNRVYGQGYNHFIHHAQGSGNTNGIQIILDANKLKPQYKATKTYKSTFRMSIQHLEDFPLPFLEGIDLEGGYKISIVISPKVLVSSASVKSLEIAQRDCKFQDEIEDMTLFKKYNQKACYFDCMWQLAFKLCECVPWKYPNPGRANTICSSGGNFCWRNSFKSANSALHCTSACPYDCNVITYPYYVVKQEIKPWHCDREEQTYVKIKEFIEHYQTEQHLAEFWRMMDKVENKYDNYAPNYNCSQRIVEDIVILEIFYGGPFAEKLSKDIRASFSDKLASIGGTLGLFCGMSFMSFFELFLWMAKFCCSFIASVFFRRK